MLQKAAGTGELVIVGIDAVKPFVELGVISGMIKNRIIMLILWDIAKLDSLYPFRIILGVKMTTILIILRPKFHFLEIGYNKFNFAIYISRVSVKFIIKNNTYIYLMILVIKV